MGITEDAAGSTRSEGSEADFQDLEGCWILDLHDLEGSGGSVQPGSDQQGCQDLV